MRQLNLYRFLGFFLFPVFVLVMSSCVRTNKQEIDLDIYFSAETLTEDGKDLYAEYDSSFVFKGSGFRSDLASLSGDYSYLTTSKNAFALGLNIPGIKPDNYVKISIWRKGNSAKSHLISGSTTRGIFYRSTNIAVDTLNGWEKLELQFFIPPNYTDKMLKFYVWNNSNDTVFFDDLSIRITARKHYPEFNESPIYIEVDTSEYIKLMQVRKQAFELGVLQSDDESWVKGFVISNDEMMKTKLRLKGDWLDHLYGDKWSFRLKLKSGFTWNRMRTFSLHNPVTRHGVDEWFLHQVSLSEGLLTTRYGFVPTYFYGKNIGLYAWEEHFTKQLVESQDKREGPIVRFFEDVYWDQIRGKKSGIDSIRIPFFEAAVIKPFSTSKVIEDSVAFNQFLIAQNLMIQYKNRTKPASDIFNTDALAKYFALNDVFQGHHSLIWHNQRFYYNPVLCKLEPIMFDAYTEEGIYNWVSRSITGNLKFNAVETLDDQYLMMRALFNDTILLADYIKYLEYYSSEDFLVKMQQEYENQAYYLDSLVQKEFPDMILDIPALFANAENIRNDLPDFKKKIAERKVENKNWVNVSKKKMEFTDGLDSYFAKNLVLIYKEKQQGDSSLISVVSYYTDPVLVLGVGKTDKLITEFIHPEPEMKAYQHNIRSEYTCWVHSEANYLFMMTGEKQETVAAEIMQWPEPRGYNTPVQQLLASSTFPDPTLIEKIDNTRVYAKKGDILIDHPIVIPAGYELVIGKGTTIDMIDNAFLISYSPVFMNGSVESPIRITSSDFSSNGFVVLQAAKKSNLNHVVFENLNTLDYKGWTLTGALTFYESDVSITNTKFYRNQCEDALNTIRSKFTVDNCEFDYIFGDAFDSDFCTGIVKNTVFTNIGNDAIDFSGSTINISHVTIDKADDKGISGGEKSTLFVENTKISNSNIGIASKDLSVVEVWNSDISNCNYGLVLLQKKPEYGAATILLNSSSIRQPKTEMLIEKGSKVVVDGLEIKGQQKKLADIFYN